MVYPAKERSGQALVEFALVIPILVLILAGIFDLGQGIYAYNVVSSAAREGARFGVVNPNNKPGIQTQAKANTTALDPTRIDVPFPQCGFNPSAPDHLNDPCSPGNFIRVTVTYTYQPITIFFASIPLRGDATMTIE